MMHACCCAVKRCLTRALLHTQLLGEEGSGTSSAVRRGGRPAVAAVLSRQESTTSLQRLAVHAHTQSAGERCVVGAVVAYACLLVLSGARAQPQGPRPCPLRSVQPRALRLRSAARTPHAARTRTTRDCCALPRRCCALGALCAVLRRFPPRVWKLRQCALTRPSCTTQLPWCSTSPTAPATRAACSSAPPGRAGERAAHGREGIYRTAPRRALLAAPHRKERTTPTQRHLAPRCACRGAGGHARRGTRALRPTVGVRFGTFVPTDAFATALVPQRRRYTRTAARRGRGDAARARTQPARFPEAGASSASEPLAIARSFSPAQPPHLPSGGGMPAALV